MQEPSFPELDEPRHTRVNVLFVCSRNQWRSPTAERVFRRHPRMAVRSAGTSRRARRSVTANDLRWADVVLVMEAKHKQRLVGTFKGLVQHLPIEVLDIPDDYQAMDPELIAILEVAVPAALGPWLEVP